MLKKYRLLPFVSLLLFYQTTWSAEQTPATLSSLKLELDTVWLVVAGCLVFLMQTGFAMLEAGMVRAKNTVNVILKNYTDMCFGAIAFWLIGFGLMFGTNHSGFVGTDHFLLGNAKHMDYSMLFFQIMVAATAATIVSGALAERVRFQTYLVACVIITALIYPIFGSWVWGGQFYEGLGWLKKLGFQDFAGGAVVHSVGGWCALAGIIVLGPRLGKYDAEGKPRAIAGHNLPMVALGGLVLWFGAFGFNGGMLAKAGGSLGLILLNTHLAAAAGTVGAVIGMTIKKKPILLTHTIYGSIGGLVSIAAGANHFEPVAAIATGSIAGAIIIYGIDFMDSRGWDDPVGAVSVHAFCGTWGVLAVGFFASGKPFDPKAIGIQIIGIIACFIWSFGAAFVMFKLLERSIGMRASTISQQRGLDYAEHHEVGYPEFQKDLLHQGKKTKP